MTHKDCLFVQYAFVVTATLHHSKRKLAAASAVANARATPQVADGHQYCTSTL